MTETRSPTVTVTAGRAATAAVHGDFEMASTFTIEPALGATRAGGGARSGHARPLGRHLHRLGRPRWSSGSPASSTRAGSRCGSCLVHLRSSGCSRPPAWSTPSHSRAPRGGRIPSSSTEISFFDLRCYHSRARQSGFSIELIKARPRCSASSRSPAPAHTFRSATLDLAAAAPTATVLRSRRRALVCAHAGARRAGRLRHTREVTGAAALGGFDGPRYAALLADPFALRGAEGLRRSRRRLS